MEEEASSEPDFTNYLKFGLNLLQHLKFYYEKGSIENKQKLIGSIFPENIIIENNKCRTTRENEVIIALRGFARASEGIKRKSLQR